jgi:hypothetical protein
MKAATGSSGGLEQGVVVDLKWAGTLGLKASVEGAETELVAENLVIGTEARVGPVELVVQAGLVVIPAAMEPIRAGWKVLGQEQAWLGAGWVDPRGLGKQVGNHAPPMYPE